MRLPPVQNLLTQKFEEVGLDLSKAATVINHIVDMYEQNPQVSLSALNMFFKYTLPAQTQKTVNQNLNVNTDLETFSKQAWHEDVPLIFPEEGS